MQLSLSLIYYRSWIQTILGALPSIVHNFSRLDIAPKKYAIISLNYKWSGDSR